MLIKMPLHGGDPLTRPINGRHSNELRNEAAKLVVKGGLPANEASRQLSLPKFTLENGVKVFKADKLGDVGSQQRPLTEIELKLDRVKRELAFVRQEHDTLRKKPRTFPRSRYSVRDDQRASI